MVSDKSDERWRGGCFYKRARESTGVVDRGAKSTCHTKNTTIDEKLLSSLSGKLAETCYNCARFSNGREALQNGTEGTRFDFDFLEDESPLNEELEEKRNTTMFSSKILKLHHFEERIFIRLNDLSKAS